MASRPLPSPPSSPSYTKYLELFLEMMAVDRGASPHTLAAYQRDLEGFLQAPLGSSSQTIRPEDVRTYLKTLEAQSYAPASKARKLSSLKQFFAFLVEENFLEEDPTSVIRSPKRGKSLPKILDEEEVTHLLKVARDDTTKEGVRLSFMLELLYATGLRVSEMLTLPYAPFCRPPKDQDIAWISVVGKGQKERLVPLPERVLETLKAYQQHRSAFIENGVSSKWLFPSGSKAGHLTRQRFGQVLKDLAARAGLPPEKISPHVVRHAFATHFLNRGGDLLSVQKLLGHADISTTEIYTHVMTDRLQELLTHHPLARKTQRA